MKNLKLIGQSIATGAGAALLASFASLFASSEAHAANLIRENGETGAVRRIEGLSVLFDGEEKVYDVDFLGGTFLDVVESSPSLLDVFSTKGQAEAAFASVVSSLGTTEYVSVTLKGGLSDSFLIAYRESSSSVRVIADLNRNVARDTLTENGYLKTTDTSLFGRKWAKFVEAEKQLASTPEPSLIFGFITLGGLILGSKIKKKS